VQLSQLMFHHTQSLRVCQLASRVGGKEIVLVIEDTTLNDCRILITGGGGLVGSHIADQLVRRGIREVVIFDSFIRGCRENLANAMNSSSVRIVEGDIRDRRRLAEAMSGVELLFHQAAIRITQCAEEPRLALEVLVEGTFNVLEAAVQ